MNSKERVNYWVEMAVYDLDTARVMLQGGRYLYVAFMCHQVVEKMLKAYWSATLTDTPLKIHSLSRLAERCGLDAQMSEEQRDVIDELEPMNIEARYPSYKDRLMSSLTHARCERMIEDTNTLMQWIGSRL